MVVIDSGPLAVEIRHGSLSLRGVGPPSRIDLDAWNSRENQCFISHAHADHVPAARMLDDNERIEARMSSGETAEDTWRSLVSSRVTASPETMALLAARFKWPEVPAGLPRDIEGLSLAPSGHVLGSTALVASVEGTTAMYTGDFNTSQGRLYPPMKPVPCDILACECTFGLPRYEFPPFEAVAKAVEDWIDDALRKGPVVMYGHALGKNQEILSMLGPHAAETRIIADEDTCAVADVYRASGIDLPACEPYKTVSRSKWLERNDGWAVVLPIEARFAERYYKLDATRCLRAALSGWALDPAWIEAHRVDAGFPLSDHAGFSDIIGFIETCGPSDVILTHGPGAIVKAKLLEHKSSEISETVERDVRVHVVKEG